MHVKKGHTIQWPKEGLGLWCVRPLSTIFQIFRGKKSALLVEETGIPLETHWPAASYWQALLYRLAWSEFELTTVVVICTDYIGGYKSNYHDHDDPTWPEENQNMMTHVIYRLLILFMILTQCNDRSTRVDHNKNKYLSKYRLETDNIIKVKNKFIHSFNFYNVCSCYNVMSPFVVEASASIVKNSSWE